MTSANSRISTLSAQEIV